MVQTGRRAAMVAAVLVGCLLSASGCTVDYNQKTGPVVYGDVAVDAGAKIVISPVDYGGLRVVAASFGTPMLGRAVILQSQDGSGWKDMATREQDNEGRVEFKLKDAKDDKVTYRAVAQQVTSDGKAQEAKGTPAISADQQWKSALDTDFSGSELDSKAWSHRFEGIYDAGGRHCSAPYASNVVLNDGKVKMSVTKETKAANIAKAKAADCKEPNNYRNAMITTETKLTVATGIMAARVKFPEGQGMHGSIWLQSYQGKEIDMVESFGYGGGVTSVIHADGKRVPETDKDTYVNKEAVKDKSWWSDYHVFSAQWDAGEVIFRVDGAETRRITQSMGSTDYFLVISLLSSDWEQKRFDDPVRNASGVKKTTLPQAMSVDWVKAWSPA